jgi:hypothetical protein
MNWMVVLVLIESSGKKVGSNSPSYIEWHSQNFLDIGVTSSMCTSRKLSSKVVSKPLMRQGTTNPAVNDCFWSFLILHGPWTFPGCLS